MRPFGSILILAADRKWSFVCVCGGKVLYLVEVRCFCVLPTVNDEHGSADIFFTTLTSFLLDMHTRVRLLNPIVVLFLIHEEPSYYYPLRLY